ncbi:MAG: hypothetical protein QGH33_14220, partial [Pirellulaceae bacterium]|nr:hypothetical protein [Pirellulaceae bacterium]
MNRRLDQPFNCQLLADLTRQLLFAPSDKRIEQVRRAEQLHDQVDDQANYPYDFIFYRITGYHTETDEPTLLVGTAVLPDLRRLIDRLSRSVAMPQDPDEPTETIHQLAKRLNVSTKTIERYRQMGLRWRWCSPIGKGRKFIVFTGDAVERFLSKNAGRVKRATYFTQIADPIRQKLLQRARQLAAGETLTLNQVARRLASESGRAVETMRLILEHHDQTQPAMAIFPNRLQPLTARQKQLIVRALRMGVSVNRLAERFGRTRSTIYRAARDRRAAELHRLDIQYVESPKFTQQDAHELFPVLDVEMEQTPSAVRDPKAHVDDLPAELRPLYGQRGMGRDQVRAALARYNYLKFKASQLRDALNRYEPRAKDLDQIEQWLTHSAQIRHCLITSHLHVVLSVARRHLIDQVDRSPSRLAEMLIAGNVVLLEAIDQFEF